MEIIIEKKVEALISLFAQNSQVKGDLTGQHDKFLTIIEWFLMT